MRWIFLLCLLCSCAAPEEEAPEMQTIPGRDRVETYRAKIPESWIKSPPSEKESLADTTKPIYQLSIPCKEGDILITVHNFPTEKFEERIPAEAQAARWRSQLGEALVTEVRPQSFGGFCGLRFDGEAENLAVTAWAMLLAPEHYPQVEGGRRADYTIKAVGPPSAMGRHREEIAAFARSFELIEEIPQP